MEIATISLVFSEEKRTLQDFHGREMPVGGERVTTTFGSFGTSSFNKHTDRHRRPDVHSVRYVKAPKHTRTQYFVDTHTHTFIYSDKGVPG